MTFETKLYVYHDHMKRFGFDGRDVGRERNATAGGTLRPDLITVNETVDAPNVIGPDLENQPPPRRTRYDKKTNI